MSYSRVQIVESSVPWSKAMRAIKKDGVPALNAQVKAGNLKRWQIIQTGENSGLLINEFENKSQMNKYNKGVSTARQDVDDAVGGRGGPITARLKPAANSSPEPKLLCPSGGFR